MLTQSSIYKEYLDLMDTEAWKYYIIEDIQAPTDIPAKDHF